MSIHDAYMDGETFTAKSWTVTTPDGYWFGDTKDLKTAEKWQAECGGTIKPYDGNDKYAPR